MLGFGGSQHVSTCQGTLGWQCADNQRALLLTPAKCLCDSWWQCACAGSTGGGRWHPLRVLPARQGSGAVPHPRGDPGRVVSVAPPSAEPPTLLPQCFCPPA